MTDSSKPPGSGPQTFGQHVGVFLLILAGTYLLVHFVQLDPELLMSVPVTFFIYLGLFYVFRRKQ